MKSCDLVRDYVREEGLVMLKPCLTEASNALGVKYSLSDLLMTHNAMVLLCVLGAWNKRIRSN